MKTNNKLMRDQLQQTLEKFQPLLKISIPPMGWIRAVRNTLGMSGRQLGKRLGITKQRVSIIERQEIDGTATLKTLRRAAESLDCVFVYGFAFRKSLEETVRNQATKVAFKRLSRAIHTMRLEDQALSSLENKEILSNMIEEIMNEIPINFWDE